VFAKVKEIMMVREEWKEKERRMKYENLIITDDINP
jgi:hypothetical protein